jgi:hypothetical protein
MFRKWVRMTHRLISSVVPWFLVLLAGASLATGHLSMRRGASSTAESEEDARAPMRRDIQRYDARLIHAVQVGAEQKGDWLTNFESFDEFWHQVSPRQPLWFQMISPRAVDSAGKEIFPEVSRRAVLIDKQNFSDHRLLLLDIEDLILSGDGTGKGFLTVTRFDAEPAREQRPETQAGRTAIR